MALNARQQRFVDEYLIDFSVTQAAIRAGLSAKTAGSAGSRLLKNVEILAAVNKARFERSVKMEITAASITERLMQIADKAQTLEGPAALNVARQSVMDVAKLNGLVVDTHETVNRNPEERRARLHELRSERERLSRTH